MLAGGPVWKNGGLELTLECRNDIPSYTVRGYSLSAAIAGGEVISQQLPDLAPGEVRTVFVELPVDAGSAAEAKDASARTAALSILRPTGFSVLELQLG